MTSRLIWGVFMMFFTTLLLSCNPYKVNKDINPIVEGNDKYSLPAEGIKLQSRWWVALDDPFLDAIIKKALSDNLTVKQARARIEQAIATDKQAASFLYPEITGRASGVREWKGDDRPEDGHVAGLALSWEIDLWGRISAASKAAQYEIRASREDLEAVAVLLTAQVAETYYQIIEQQLQLSLLERQIKAGETLLELTELRFGYGEASVVDVFQQRQQLASTRSRVPIAKSSLRTLENRLHVQLGMAPERTSLKFANDFPQLTDLPLTGVPIDLLKNRPDLRRIYNELVSFDYRVAEAVADRFPKIGLSGNASFTNGFSTEDRLLSLLLEAVAPVLDWNRREAEVEKRKAVLKEELARYTQVYLIAIEEVENALWQEQYQLELLNALEQQISIARLNLAETGNRYRQGLTDYLPVLAALQSLQLLERDILSRQRELISIRILLYRALGGSQLTDVHNQSASSENFKRTSISKGVIQ